MGKTSRRTARILCLLCITLLLAALPCPAAAQTRERETLRVGFFAFDGYHMQDEDGERSGYGYEYLQHMAGYTDWQYEYVGYDSNWNEMQEMLARGELDLVTSAQKTPERMERFDFSDEPIGTSAAILTVKAGDIRFAAGEHDGWNGMRIGMLEGNSRNEDLAEYAAEEGFAYTPVFYDDTARMTEALQAGERIDAILTSDLRAIDGEWILARFAPSPFYIIVQKGNDRLLDEINLAIAQLDLNEPGLRTKLMNTYYMPDSGDEIAFTSEERAYIAAMKDYAFTALLNPDRAPLSGFTDGEPDGILSEIAAEIISRSGLTIRIAETADRADYRKRAEAGDADIRLDAWYNYAEAEAHGYRLTAPYLDASISRLYLKNKTGFRSVALLRDADISREYEHSFLQQYEEVVYYDTVAEVIDAVLSGRQDMAYLYSRCAELAVQNDVTNRLASDALYGYETAFAVAVSAKQDSRLFSILQKSVASIGEKEIETIVRRNTTYSKKPFSLIGYMYDYPLHMVAFVCMLFFVLALILLAASQSRRRKLAREQLVEEQRRNRLLADALSAAERADAAKSQFLSRVSHEMRTPLNAIIGFMALARDANAEQAETYRMNSEVAARQLLAVINDVLDMSSIESGKIKIAHAPFDFKRMLHDVTNIFLTQCAEKGLSYETRLSTPLDEWLVGDSLRVNQILTNLLGNAVKFTEKGHVHLTVSQLAAQGSAVFIRFAVTDTGCGMREEMLTRLFQPFEQESAETARRFGGSGLGLSIVKNLVSMMDGAIRVESKVDEGTTFTVDLPFGRSEAVQSLRMPGGIRDLRVLAVDDEPVEREYLSAVLGRMQVRHTSVGSGDEALFELARAEAEQDAYNLCLVDWRMPGMNGVETTRRIRSLYGEGVVVIVVSAYEQHQVNESARAAGANYFISKPLFPSSLFDLFMTLTGGSGAQKESSPLARDFTGRRVLLAEDNAMNRMVAAGLIGKLGIVCDVAEDGRIAVEKFLASASGYYDAILMDIQMPNMDGFAATKAIRASSHPDAETVAIIALSADAFNEDIVKSLSGGMNAHVAKPIEPEALVRALEKAFLEKDGR